MGLFVIGYVEGVEVLKYSAPRFDRVPIVPFQQKYTSNT
jgi:hypothetical protein